MPQEARVGGEQNKAVCKLHASKGFFPACAVGAVQISRGIHKPHVAADVSCAEDHGEIRVARAREQLRSSLLEQVPPHVIRIVNHVGTESLFEKRDLGGKRRRPVF